MSGARFLSKRRAADRWSSGSVGAPDTVRCTPDSPVCPTDRWRDHVSREDCAADRWRWRPVVHRTVQCTTGQSGELYSYVAVETRERRVHRRPAWRTGHYPVHHRTVRCAKPSWSLLHIANSFSNSFLTVSSTYTKHISTQNNVLSLETYLFL
jgi:hypothetical protein